MQGFAQRRGGRACESRRLDRPVAEPRTLEGEHLPPRLLDLPEPPARLFLQGTLPSGLCVGIVGTRSPSPEALGYAEQLAHWLATRGVAVLSGGAKGIDLAAHRGALAASGLTWVVAPSSFDRPFPAAHGALYAEVVQRGGGYLSRFEQGVAADRPRFFERNGILVALCHALILVEAPLRSGARNAAKWARRLGRPCFVVPSPPWNERGRGCILELQLGARALAGPEEVLAALEASPAEARGAEAARAAAAAPARAVEARPRPARGRAGAASSAAAPGSPPVVAGPALRVPRPELDRLENGELSRAMLSAIDQGARYPDEIAQAVGASMPQVSHELLLLTLRGEVCRGPGGQVTRAPR